MLFYIFLFLLRVSFLHFSMARFFFPWTCVDNTGCIAGFFYCGFLFMGKIKGHWPRKRFSVGVWERGTVADHKSAASHACESQR
jgi:hypothetical protein